jgi:hypothetical protein
MNNNKRERSMMLDPAVPASNIVFKPVYDDYGLRLALVFGNHADGGVCPYARAKRCHHCDIGRGEGVQFDTETNLRRLKWFKTHYAQYWYEVAHLVIYNSGSTLNPQELAPQICLEIMAFARDLPRLQVVSMDSREAFVNTEYIRQLAGILGPGRSLRIILGIESADEQIRNVFLNKKMPKRMIDKAMARFYHVWSETSANSRHKMATPGLSVNVVIGSPGTTAETVIADGLETARYAMQLAEQYDLPLDINLHPFYPSQRSVNHFPNHKRVSTHLVEQVIQAIKAILTSDKVKLFVGLQDEHHDQEPEKRADDLLFYQTGEQWNNVPSIR